MTPSDVTATGPFAEPRRLHPASIVLGIDLRQLIQALVFPVAASLAAGRMAVTVGAIILFVVIGSAVRILQWERLTFRFDGEVFRVDAGVLRRVHRALDVARIQQVELDRTLVERLLGLATLRIETAVSTGEPEVELRVLPQDDAVTLRDAVRASKIRRAPADGAGAGAAGAAATDAGIEGAAFAPPTAVPVLRVPIRHVALAAVTGSRLLVFPAVVLGALQLLGDATGQDIDPAALLRLLLRAGLVVTVLVAVPAAFAVALVTGVVRDGHFEIDQVGDDLHVRRGLLATREAVVPLRRVQLVEVRRNWIRRALGYATVRVHSAGGSDAADRRVVVPLIPEHAVPALLGWLLGAAPPAELYPHPPAALRRAVIRWVRDLGVFAVAAWLLPFLNVPVVWLPIVLPIAVALGFVEYRQLAHRADARLLASRRGALAVTTSYVPLVKVQAVTVRRSPFQRRLAVATLRVHVAGTGGSVEVLDAGDQQVQQLRPHLVARAALRDVAGAV